jgi:hypothetical protein
VISSNKRLTADITDSERVADALVHLGCAGDDRQEEIAKDVVVGVC